MVCIQVSLFRYRDHNSKVTNMFKNKQSLPELKIHDNLLNFYKFITKNSYSKYNKHNTLFVYISPKTQQEELDGKDRLKLFKKHSEGRILVGVAYKCILLFRYLEMSLC